MTMNCYPNQRILTVKFELEKPFGAISRKAERIAVRKLDNGTAAYILFIHLSLNKNGHQLAFSPAAIEAELGISKDRCRKAFNVLVEKGYLKQARNSNHYTFYQLPPEYANEDIGADTDIVVDMNTTIDRADTLSTPTTTIYPHSQALYIPTERERNNTDNINITNNIAFDNEQDDTLPF